MTTLKPLVFALCTLWAVPACMTEATPDELEQPDPAPDTDDPDPEPQPEPTKEYGAECEGGAECVDGLCIDGLCSRFCDIDDVNSCQDVEAFCVPLQSGAHGCYGYADTGRDPDGAIITIGELKASHFGTLGDADLFRLDYWRAGRYEVFAQGDGVDVQIEFFNSVAEPVGIFTGGGVGNAAAAVATIYEPGHDWLVVRNVGNTTGPYSIGLFELE